MSSMHVCAEEVVVKPTCAVDSPAAPHSLTPASHPVSAPSVLPPTRRRWRFRFLSPTIDIDVGEADYATASPRMLSFEYLFGAVVLVSLNIYGFVILTRFCNANGSPLFDVIEPPLAPLQYLGAKGFDNFLDGQFVSYRNAVWILALLGMGLGLGSSISRRLTQPLRRVHLDDATELSCTSDDLCGSPVVTVKSEPLSSAGSTLLLSDTESEKVTQRSLLSTWLSDRFASQYGLFLLPLLYIVVGLVFTTVMHGPHFFLPLLLTCANYVVFTRVQRRCSYRVFMAIMWVTHVSLLYVIEYFSGFENAYILQLIAPTSIDSSSLALGRENARKGLWSTRMRWYIAFRMTTLRLIAFNYDLWEATHGAARARERAAAKHDTTCIECAQLREHNNNNTPCLPAEASRCYKYRTEYVRDPSDYNLINYLAYILFPPLYIAGPMSSFNAFVSYMRVPSVSISWRGMAVYALRILGIYAALVVLMHFVFVSAVSSYTFLMLKMSNVEQAHFFFYSLAYIWLKFSFIWKTSRLFAMFSGIEVPEDLHRYFCNTLTIREYWQDWHASFNLWIVRYMYIPMGGRSRVALSVLPIFLFIAIWHDPALQLIKWALCIAVMFVIELVVSACFGWVSGVFTREMAAVGTARTAHDEDVEEGEAQGDTHSSQRSSGGAVTALLRPPARFAARHLSPRVRAWCYRMLRVMAGMSTVFGLVVANLVGFSMQNSTATIEKADFQAHATDVDRSMRRTLQSSSAWLVLGLIMGLYAIASLAAIDRDYVFYHRKTLKQRYGLK